MPCGLCGDIIPTEIARCPACGAWARRRDFRALGIGVFMLLGFNAFMALGSGISLIRLLRPLSHMPSDSYDPAATGTTLAPYADVFVISGMLAMITGVLFVSWLWRAHGQSLDPHRYGRAWVVGSWLLPVANLWVPPRLVHDVWMSSGRFHIIERHRAGLLVTSRRRSGRVAPTRCVTPARWWTSASPPPPRWPSPPPSAWRSSSGSRGSRSPSPADPGPAVSWSNLTERAEYTSSRHVPRDGTSIDCPWQSGLTNRCARPSSEH
jgi:hypothetical protein